MSPRDFPGFRGERDGTATPPSGQAPTGPAITIIIPTI
jgi:hypothetical protein